MKVFNITDASTSALEARGLIGQAIKVGDVIIPAGGSAVLRGTARERSELQVYIKVGAVSLDELPPAYAARRKLNLDGTPATPPPDPAPDSSAPSSKEAEPTSEKAEPASEGSAWRRSNR